MQTSLLLASVLLTLLAFGQPLYAKETEKEPPVLEIKPEEIPMDRTLKGMKKEDPAEMKKMMKAKGLIDISEEEGLVPLITATDGTAIPNQYIAHLLPGGQYEKIRRILKNRGSPQRAEFNKESSYVILKGVDKRDLQRLRKLTEDIEEIEQDKEMKLDGYYCEDFPASEAWNLDRIDDSPNDDRFVTWADGTGIDAYVMDTGINPDHSDLKGRVSLGWHASVFSDSRDSHGHGTHVASILGGATYGAAKKVTLIPVKVCGTTECSTSDTVEGLNWIKTQVKKNKRLSIINMSLGGTYSSSLNKAVYAVLDAGIPVVLAAGNDDQAGACNKSPASVTGALTVGATQKDDYVAYFSNIGSCVDIYAPGRHIRAANYANINGWTEKSGTSMASPLVAGAAAGMLQVLRDAGYANEPSVSVVDSVNYYINKFAKKGTVKGLPSTNNNNVMLYTCCLVSS